MITNKLFKELIKIPKNFRNNDGIFIRHKNKIISVAVNEQTSGGFELSPETESTEGFINLFEKNYIYDAININRIASGSKLELNVNEDGYLVSISSNKGTWERYYNKTMYKNILNEYSKYKIKNDEQIIKEDGENMIQYFSYDNTINIADIYDNIINNNISILMVTDKLFAPVFPYIKKDKIKKSLINVYKFNNLDNLRRIKYDFFIDDVLVSLLFCILINK